MHEPYTVMDQIHTANDSGMEITLIGTSLIPTSICDLVLKKVLHVPSTHKNLIAVHRFTLDNDTYIEFHPFLLSIEKHGRCCCTGHVEVASTPFYLLLPSFRSWCFMPSKFPLISDIVA
jgi:hypothetical protein